MINKRGASEVVSIVLIIALVMVMTGIIWAVVSNLVDDNLEKTGTCFETFGKVNINNRYTCYNSSSKELQISLSLEDISLDGVLVGISASGSSVSFKLNNTGGPIPNLYNYPSRTTNITLPGKNAGKTYYFNMSAAGFGSTPTKSIMIAPIIGKDQCDVSDSNEQVDNCLSLT